MQAIDIDVPQRAAVVFPAEHRNLRTGQVFVVAAEMLVVIGMDQADRSDQRQELTQLAEIRQVDVGDGLKDEQIPLPGDGKKVLRLFQGRGERLLAEDVMSGEQGLFRRRIVQRVGQGDINEIAIHTGQHLTIVRINLRDTETSGFFQAPTADGDDLVARNGLHRLEHLGNDSAGSDNGNFNHNGIN